MAGRRSRAKRKFDWGELSSEDESDTKKVIKKEDKKAIDDQAKKLDELSVSKSTRSSRLSARNNETVEESMEDDTSTSRSTRGNKRAIDEVDNNQAPTKDLKIKESQRSIEHQDKQ